MPKTNHSPFAPAVLIGLPDDRLPAPCPYFRKEFIARKPVRRAVATVTALGAYELRINGEKIGDHLFAPGWTDYRKRIQYQVFDVTQNLRQGRNAAGAIVGPGWYGGPMPGQGFQRFAFGTPPVKFMLKLDVEYADGSRESFVTDERWKTTTGPILLSETYPGERYDARLEMDGWDEPGFNDKQWKAATSYGEPGVLLGLQSDPPIRVTQELHPVSVNEVKKGVFIVDLGQNMVGVCRMEVSGPRGTKIKLRHGEVLNPNGTLYTENLRGAEATDTYTLRGKGRETFTPRFTYHGFRYVELTGFPGTPDHNTITGLVLHTDAPRTGWIETSSPLVNQLVEATWWGQRGNMHSVLTDCPQRDERLGWMGDANIFAPTACYLADLQTFLPKFVIDMEDAQKDYGTYTDVSPMVGDWVIPADGAPGWADAGVVVPWVNYQFYGNEELLRTHWESMQRFVDYVMRNNPDGIWKNRTGNNYGDWVPAGGRTDKTALATLLHLNTCDIIAKIAKIIGKKDEEQRYRNRHSDVLNAFRKAYVKQGKLTLKDRSQTLYALALQYGVFTKSEKKTAINELVNDIESRKTHLSTGFLGTPVLLPALSDAGRDDIAKKLLLNRDYPSWGYMLAKGATTIWELWNSDTEGPGMNSRNHFAYGSVVEWIFGYLAGIRPLEPGFRKVLIQPRPGAEGSDLTSLTAHYHSIRGLISVSWNVVNGKTHLNVSLPANTPGVLVTPSGKKKSLKPGYSTHTI